MLCEARLAHATGSEERHQAHVWTVEGVDDRVDLIVPSDQRSGGFGSERERGRTGPRVIVRFAAEACRERGKAPRFGASDAPERSRQSADHVGWRIALLGERHGGCHDVGLRRVVWIERRDLVDGGVPDTLGEVLAGAVDPILELRWQREVEVVEERSGVPPHGIRAAPAVEVGEELHGVARDAGAERRGVARHDARRGPMQPSERRAQRVTRVLRGGEEELTEEASRLRPLDRQVRHQEQRFRAVEP